MFEAARVGDDIGHSGALAGMIAGTIVGGLIAAAGGNSIPCAPYATFGTRELSEYVAVVLRNRKATLLQHHGLIACEENLEKALWLAHEVEVLAQLYLSTLAITDPVPVLDDEAIAIVLEKFKTYGLRIEE